MPLSVDAGGLKQGAVRGAAIAAGLVVHDDAASGSGDQPSHAGITALNAAIRRVRTRQAHRVEQSSAKMHVGAEAYESSDAEASGRLAGSV